MSVELVTIVNENGRKGLVASTFGPYVEGLMRTPASDHVDPEDRPEGVTPDGPSGPLDDPSDDDPGTGGGDDPTHSGTQNKE